ncbi:MAG: ATP-binding protein [Thermodesulfobacteriota bacterium]|nr:ATP-binding protein [Thermodesulfobacteriota bacterium]
MINRERELRFVVEKFREKGAQLVILWGRRRVGKTCLLKEFCSQYPAIYFLAVKSSKKDQLFQLSEAIAEFFNDFLLMIKPFSEWQQVFVYLKEKRSQRFTLIIDEFPYLISTDPAIPSIFQKGWDEYLVHNDKIVLILNGSSIAMMEKEVLGAGSPLYGRRTGQWKLEPFNLIETAGFFPKANLIRLIEIYSVIGGIPYYAQFLDPKSNIEKNIRSKILKKGEVLYEEVDFLLREEFKEPRSYFPIISAIASGSHKFGEIAGKTGMDKSNLTKYLSVLDQLHITYREVPVTEKYPHKSKKGLYFIRDPFINFWLRFVRPNLRHLEMEKIDFVWREKIAPEFDYYVSRHCEKIIVDVLETLTGTLPFDYERLGRYWDKNIEIDIMAIDREEKNVLLGEIKWQKKPVGIKILGELRKKAEKIKTLSACRKYFLLISKSGFTEAVQETASENVLLVDLGESMEH